MTTNLKKNILLGASAAAIILGATALTPSVANAAPCATSGAIVANCELDGDTSGAITIAASTTVLAQAGAVIDETINGASANVGNLSIDLNIVNTGVIGGIAPLSTLTILDTRVFTLGANVSAQSIVNNQTVSTDTFNLTGTLTQNLTDALLEISGTNGTFTGNVLAATNGFGTIAGTETGSVTGNVGASGGNALGAVTVATGRTLTIGGSAFNVVDADITGTLAFSNTIAVAGALDAAGGGARRLDLNGNATFNGVVGGNTAFQVTDIAAGTVATINNNFSSVVIDLEGAASELRVATTGRTITGAIAPTTADTGVLNIDESVTIAGTVGSGSRLDVTDVATGRVLTVSGNTYNVKTTTLAGAASELNTTAATTIGSTGSSIVAGSNGVGVLDIDHNTTLNGSVGTSTVALADVQIATGRTLTNNADIYANAITLENAATLDINTTGKTISGAINGTVANNGTVDIDENVTFKGNIGATTKIGTFDVETGNVATFDVTSNVSSIGNANKILLVNADTITLGNNLNTNIAVVTGDNSNNLFNYTTLSNSDDKIELNRTVDTTKTAAVTGNSSNALAQTPLLALITSSSTVASTLNGLNTQAGIQSAAEKLSGDVSGAGAAAVASATAGALDTVATHLADARNGNTGVAAGEGYTDSGYAFWTQAFGGAADQDTRDGVKGFESDTIGFAVGTDTALSETSRVGVSFAYAQSDVDGDSAAQTQSDIDTYQATLYGTYAPADKGYFVDGFLSYALNNTEANRNGVVAGSRINADYDTSVYRAVARVGEELNANFVKLTPSFALDYAHIATEDYNETGGAGRLNVDADAQNIFVARGELEADQTFALQNGSHIRPFASVGAQYDFIGDEYSTTSTYAGTTGTFTTTGADVAKTSGLFGTGVDWEANGGAFVLSAEANGQVKEDFFGYSGSVTARWKF
jgi:outer membrane autotransporter protein